MAYTLKSSVQWIPDGPAGTRITLQAMQQEAWKGALVPEIQQLANELGTIENIDSFLRQTWRVIPDPDETEYVRAPQLQLEIFKQYQAFVGDCDDSATFAGALVLALGYAAAFVAIRMAGALEYSHVWLRAYGPGYVVDIDPVTPAGVLPILNYQESMVVSL